MLCGRKIIRNSGLVTKVGIMKLNSVVSEGGIEEIQVTNEEIMRYMQV